VKSFILSLFVLSIVLSSQAFANEMDLKKAIKGIEGDLKKEISSSSSIELWSISENNPFDISTDFNIFGRNSNNKLQNLPAIAEKPLYSSWSKILNYEIKKLGLAEWLSYYNKYTHIGINFNVE